MVGDIDNLPSYGSFTFFDAVLEPGFLSGTLDGSINDLTNTGTFNVSGTFAGGAPASGDTASQSVVGDTSDAVPSAAIWVA